MIGIFQILSPGDVIIVYKTYKRKEKKVRQQQFEGHCYQYEGYWNY